MKGCTINKIINIVNSWFWCQLNQVYLQASAAGPKLTQRKCIHHVLVESPLSDLCVLADRSSRKHGGTERDVGESNYVRDSLSVKWGDIRNERNRYPGAYFLARMIWFIN